jgi:hypothetical protein
VVVFVGVLVASNQTAGRFNVDVGTPSDEAYVRNFHGRLLDGATPYRWSDVYGYVSLPGLGGSRTFTVTIMLDTARTAPLQIFVNGEQLIDRTYTAGWRTLTLRIDVAHPSALASRDTVIELRAPDYRTEDAPTEPKGVKVGQVNVEQDRQGGFIVPAVAPVVWLSLSLVLTFVAVARGLRGLASRARARTWALLAVALAGLALAALYASDRVAVSTASPAIAISLLTTVAILIVCDIMLRRKAVSLTVLQCRLLALAFAGAFLLRFGGMALPQSVIIDMPWHMKWLRTLLAGDWQSLYFPGGLSSVPAEWGMELLIPKSPLFYFVFAPLGTLPFELATSIKWLVSFLDASLVLVVFRLAMYVQTRAGAALLAASLYAVMPLAFRAFAYGILPTILAQWLAALLLVFVVTMGTRRWTILDWVVMIVLATLTFLSFPTVALFATIVLAGYCAGLLIWRRAFSSSFTVVRLAMSVTVAWVLAVLAYYGLYIFPVLTSAQALIAPSSGQATTVRWPGGIGDLFAFTADYVVTILPVILAATGIAVLLAVRDLSPRRRRALLLVVLWMSIAPLFFLVNYKVDMIGKHLFFVMLPVALAGGVALFRLMRTGKWGTALVAVAVALVGWQGLVFWVERLVRASS